MGRIKLRIFRHGLGSASCEPDVLKQYKLKNENFHFQIRLKAYSKDQISPMEISKVEIEEERMSLVYE